MFAHVGELWPLKLQRSILFWRQRNSNLSVWCHVTICVLEWRSLQISISKEAPGEISREIWRISFLPGYYALHLPNHQYGWQIEAPENCRMFPKMGRLPQCWLSTRRTLVNCRGSQRWELGKCTSLPSTSETPRRNCSQYCRLQIKATQIQNAHYRPQMTAAEKQKQSLPWRRDGRRWCSARWRWRWWGRCFPLNRSAPGGEALAPGKRNEYQWCNSLRCIVQDRGPGGSFASAAICKISCIIFTGDASIVCVFIRFYSEDILIQLTTFPLVC